MSFIIFYSPVKLIPSIQQVTISDNLLASGYFSSFACTISSTLLIVYRICNYVSNRNIHCKKRYVHIVDVLVQSAAAYAFALIVAAIANVVVASRDNPTLSMFAVIDYGIGAMLPFVSVRTFGVQILSKV